MKKIYLISAVLAVLAGFLLYSYMGNLEEKYREDYVQVAVASVTIPEDTQVTAEMLTITEIPRESVHQSAAVSIDPLIGGITSQTIYEGEQIIDNKIKSTTTNSGKISYSVPEGMRAITIGVDTITGVSGFIRAMDRVDIIVVMLKEEDEETFEVASLMLKNIQVVAVGTNPNSRSEEYNPPEPPGVITLLTTPNEAVKLSLASTVGKVVAVLRSPADQSDVVVPTYIGDDLLN